MKIKSLLLGSAAAFVAVSGARAADAVIIPEPEAVEYVRVCDAAGTGYFYIPGTETCLRIHGYVRYDAGFGDLNGIDIDDDGTADTWNKRARASFRVSTYADTDYGALTTYVETRWQYDTNANAAGTGYTTANEFTVNFAYIDLAGLRIGKSESLFTTFTGYGGAVINDTTGGGYGPFDTNLVQYTFTSGAFTAAIGFEQQAGTVLLNDYMPHVVAGAGFDAGMFNLTGVVGFDTVNDAWAGKIRADVDVTDNVSAFLMLMYGENDSGYTSWANGAVTDSTFSVLGGASIGLTDAATFNTQIQWAEANGLPNDEWAIAANVAYTVAPGFVVTPEVQWHRDTAGASQWGGLVRFQRSW
ncbi:MAG: porin [Oricola sp.]